MYLPPPGRPISSPPNCATTAEPVNVKRHYKKVRDADVDAWRTDRAAGMTFKAIARKHGYSFGSVHRTLTSGEVAPPTRRHGEPSLEYARRVRAWKLANDPDYRASLSRSLKKAAARRRRKIEARRAAAERQAAAVAAAKVADAEAHNLVDLNNAQLDDMPPPAPPTIWQRIVSFFR
jgi:hypothetical protein